MAKKVSERVIEDISKFEFVIDKIIEAKSCVVPDECFRRGRRAHATEESATSRATRSTSVKSRDKISTQRKMIVHPGLTDAYNLLVWRSDVIAKQVVHWI